MPYPVVPEQGYELGFSGTDSEGAFYTDGYREMPSGWLRVQVDPTDAEVLIDGFPVKIDLRAHPCHPENGAPLDFLAGLSSGKLKETAT